MTSIITWISIVGDFRPGDTALEIIGLLSGSCYSIRVNAINPSGNVTSTPAMRVQTGLQLSPPLSDATRNGAHEPASIRTTSSWLQGPELQTSKDGAESSISNSKGVVAKKANSLASQPLEQAYRSSSNCDNSGEGDASEMFDNLTERLEGLKRQREDAEKQIEEEESDFKSQLAELSKEKDRLRQSFKEKEDASNELRRQGNQLDKLNRSAQSRKAAKEKQLQQKRAERQKIKDETARRDKEIEKLRAEAEEMAAETVQCLAEKGDFVEQRRFAMQDDHDIIKTLEDEIHATGIQIKALEQKRGELNITDVDSKQSTDSTNDKDSWDLRYQSMQTQLANWRQALQQASMEEQRVKEVLSWWVDRRAANPELFAAMPSLDGHSQLQSRPQRSRQANSRGNTVSFAGHQSISLGMAGDGGVTPAFPSSGAFFNMGNGTAIASGNGGVNMSQADMETLTGGAAMSPAANELLPSNLFRDDDAANLSILGRRDPNVSTNKDLFIRHTTSTSDPSIRGPNTPVSASSRTGSILPSPRESLQNLNNLRSRSDTFEDIDGQSIGSKPASIHASMTAEANPMASNRFTNLFSSPFNRQRGKSNSRESPLLGTLKQGQSQSFPRNLEQEDMETVANRRRRGSHSYWANPMASLLARNSGHTGDDPAVITARTSTGRKSRLNMFGSKYGDLDSPSIQDQSSSSRPSSTYSQDPALQRPSSESQQTWWMNLDGNPNRNSPLGTNWVPSSGPWSHAQSRSASIQHESTTNLSIGSTPLEPDELIGPLKKQKSDQAPIGTRPQSSQRPVTPKLNPAAPTFKTLFGRGDAKKGVKQDKPGSKLNDKSREKEKDGDKTDAEEAEAALDTSPSNPRLSRDAQSITTAASTADSHDSFERSTSGTPSEAVTPSGTKEPKESLMKKITRKSSANKFNVPWSKDRGLFSSKRTGEPSTPGEIDEDTSSEGQLGKSVESAGSTPQQEKQGRTSLSWPNIRRKTKKGDALDKGSEAGEDED